jgi:uncharacterized protein YdhG (YjbR/CyaY superfamily)
MTKTNFVSMDEYIATFPEETRKKLEEVRSVIQAVVPGARAKISYQIGAFELNGKDFINFAGWKNHISIYPIPSGSEAFNKEVSQYASGKGTLRFPLDKPLPSKLIRQVVEYRIADHVKNTGEKYPKKK